MFSWYSANSARHGAFPKHAAGLVRRLSWMLLGVMRTPAWMLWTHATTFRRSSPEWTFRANEPRSTRAEVTLVAEN